MGERSREISADLRRTKNVLKMEKDKKDAKIKHLPIQPKQVAKKKIEVDVQQIILQDLEDINRKLDDHFKEK